MIRRLVLGAAFVAFAAPAFAESATPESAPVPAPAVKAEAPAPAPTEAAATPAPSTTAETAPASKMKFGGSGGGCMFSASAPVS